jgi:hypothetical protein
MEEKIDCLSRFNLWWTINFSAFVRTADRRFPL